MIGKRHKIKNIKSFSFTQKFNFKGFDGKSLLWIIYTSFNGQLIIGSCAYWTEI